ncbi:MAG: hypothetical protein AB8I80_01205, partial [Anaerolineae bacterium]
PRCTGWPSSSISGGPRKRRTKRRIARTPPYEETRTQAGWAASYGHYAADALSGDEFFAYRAADVSVSG